MVKDIIKLVKKYTKNNVTKILHKPIKMDNIKKKLLWYNENKYHRRIFHFIFYLTFKVYILGSFVKTKFMNTLDHILNRCFYNNIIIYHIFPVLFLTPDPCCNT